ncbi:MAG: zinc-ribbon domain-containing protein [Candidatus Hodarchaeales archaeon]
MFCDNCGNAVDDDDATFCSKCGESLKPGKAPGDVPPPRRSYRRKQTSDNLCFGEENKNLGFLLIGISAIVQARRGSK